MYSQKILAVVSDTHGNFNALQQVMERHPRLDALLFLGDGMREFEDIQSLYPAIPMMGVPGNCDYGYPDPHTKIYFCQGKKLMLTHGHFYQVKVGVEYLITAAAAAGAAAVLYGHTHRPVAQQEPNGLWRINPGSLGMSGSYGLLSVGKKIEFQLCQL